MFSSTPSNFGDIQHFYKCFINMVALGTIIQHFYKCFINRSKLDTERQHF